MISHVSHESQHVSPRQILLRLAAMGGDAAATGQERRFQQDPMHRAWGPWCFCGASSGQKNLETLEFTDSFNVVELIAQK